VSKFLKYYCRSFIILVISSNITAALFWSNDFTLARITSNTLFMIVFAIPWAGLELKIRRELGITDTTTVIKQDEKPKWPPVVNRKD
jgi:hypothetical protein